MKSFTTGLALLQLASIGYAAPGSTRLQARQASRDVITFQGAGPNPPSYTDSIPNDGSTFHISNSLSISHIISPSTNPGTCTFTGIDGSVTVVRPGQTVNVGPPQTQVSGTCSTPPTRRQLPIFDVDVEFIGAGPNPPTFDQEIAADGTAQAVDTTLSVSHISLPIAAGDDLRFTCTFTGIDGSTTVVSSGQTVDVGPPQQEVSAVCTRDL